MGTKARAPNQAWKKILVSPETDGKKLLKVPTSAETTGRTIEDKRNNLLPIRKVAAKWELGMKRWKSGSRFFFSICSFKIPSLDFSLFSKSSWRLFSRFLWLLWRGSAVSEITTSGKNLRPKIHSPLHWLSWTLFWPAQGSLLMDWGEKNNKWTVPEWTDSQYPGQSHKSSLLSQRRCPRSIIVRWITFLSSKNIWRRSKDVISWREASLRAFNQTGSANLFTSQWPFELWMTFAWGCGWA